MPTVAYRVNRGRRKFAQSAKVKRQLESHIDSQVKPELIKRFERVVVNWQHKPEFKARKFVTVDEIQVNVFPAGEHKMIWIYVSGGTKPHEITPKNAYNRLFFEWGGPGSYKPKTRPVGRFGGPGVVMGGSLAVAKSVQHPGTEAREFEKAIRDDYRREFSRSMEAAWRRIIRSL